jgi:hypothetical protein
MLDLSGFICYNEIRDRVGREENNKNKEIGGEIKAEERRGNNNER